jgi:hypothetical protein
MRVIQDTYRKALRASMQEILNLLAALPVDKIQNTIMSDGSIDANMGKYHNDMD